MPVDAAAYSSALGAALDGTSDEFKQELGILQNIVSSIGWWNVRPDMFMNEITDLTFESLKNVEDLMKDVVFEPIDGRVLFDASVERFKTRLWQDLSLDTAESRIISKISAAGQGVLSELSGVSIPQDLLDSLVAKIDASDNRDFNEYHRLHGLYPTPDQGANTAWINTRRQLVALDRGRMIYSDLFELAQENIRWAKSIGVSIEEMHADFTARYNELYLNTTQANIAAYKADVLANIIAFQNELRQIDAELKVELLKFRKESAEKEMSVDQANKRVQEYTRMYASFLGSNQKLLSARIAGGKNVADGYYAILNAYGGQYTSIYKEEV